MQRCGYPEGGVCWDAGVGGKGDDSGDDRDDDSNNKCGNKPDVVVAAALLLNFCKAPAHTREYFVLLNFCFCCIRLMSCETLTFFAPFTELKGRGHPKKKGIGRGKGHPKKWRFYCSKQSKEGALHVVMCATAGGACCHVNKFLFLPGNTTPVDKKEMQSAISIPIKRKHNNTT